jgi:hypothetical protein
MSAARAQILEEFGVAVPASTLRRWILLGVRGERLPAVRVGGRLYVETTDLQKWLATADEPVEVGS